MKCQKLTIFETKDHPIVLYGIVVEDLPLSFKFRTRCKKTGFGKNYELSKNTKYLLQDSEIEYEGE